MWLWLIRLNNRIEGDVEVGGIIRGKGGAVVTLALHVYRSFEIAPSLLF